ncbi:hypothetical protein B0O99DRAFT_499704 [Bisporella sp. PMI_857]|nr:hypothetical protein B0O99DRAFT_499704 [Bisporella sp. PMI_857]
MKLIVAGSTGFVATEIIRQALSLPSITSVAALGRRVAAVPQNIGPNADASKLRSVLLENFEDYPDSIKQELRNADACIWTIAITPSGLNKMPFEEVREICLGYTVKGLETIAQLPRESTARPFRFIYISGVNAERDQSKKPWVLGDYCLMRGEIETRVLEYAKQSGGSVEACVAKPGLINGPGKRNPVQQVLSTIGRTIIGIPKVEVNEIAAALLDQAINGIKQETLLNEDLVRIGQNALKEEPKDS